MGGLSLKRSSLVALILAIILLFPTVALAQEPANLIRTWPTDERVVALTFDAGSDMGVSDEILSTLDEYRVGASFFFTGQWIERYPEAARRIAATDHTIGNHSFSHPDMRELSDEQVREELARTEEIAQREMDQGLRPFFRPPYGGYNDDLLRMLAAEGYDYCVMWTVDTLDWDGASAQTMLSRVQDVLRPGAIILMHVGSGTATAEALPLILDHLQEQGYRPITLQEMAEQESEGRVYQVQPGDTLYGIALETGVDAEDIARANNLNDPFVIQVGQTLIIPGAQPDEPAEDPAEEEPAERIETPEESTEQEEREPEPDPVEPPPEEEIAEPGAPEESEQDYPWWSFPFRMLGILWRAFWALASEGIQLLVDFIRR